MEKSRVGIIAALSTEVEALKNELLDKTEEEIAGTKYYLGAIGDYEVVLMQCGMGKVSAASGAQAMISEYHPDYIINTGCAGALDKGLRIGDVVIATETVEWDLDTMALGNPRGYVSALDKVFMDADKEIGDIIAGNVSESVRVIRGLVVSGDQFVSKDEQRSIIFGAFPDALCAEMEGAAIGHVCTQNNIPFCIVRSMSDTADGDSGIDFAEYSAKAGEKSAKILLNMLKK